MVISKVFGSKQNNLNSLIFNHTKEMRWFDELDNERKIFHLFHAVNGRWRCWLSLNNKKFNAKCVSVNTAEIFRFCLFRVCAIFITCQLSLTVFSCHTTNYISRAKQCWKEVERILKWRFYLFHIFRDFKYAKQSKNKNEKKNSSECRKNFIQRNQCLGISC